jgi:hypothetical protein
MKVLVAGLTNPENQFVRGLRKLGCDPVHTNADPGNFPRDADAVIIVLAQLNKNKMFKIKEVYDGRPIIVARDSFSEISNQFQEIMFNYRKPKIIAPPPKPRFEPKPKFQNSLGAAFAKAEPKVETQSTEPKKLPEKEMAPPTNQTGRIIHDRETVQKIYRLVHECKESGLNVRETVEMLTAEGYRKANGKAYDDQAVYAMISNIKLGKYKLDLSMPLPAPRPTVTPPPPQQLSLVSEPIPELPRSTAQPVPPTPAPIRPAPVAQQPAAPQDGLTQLQLIDQVMKIEMDPRDKLDLISKIQAGKVKQIERTEIAVMELGKQPHLHILKSSILRPASENPEVVLSKAQCELVLSNLLAINNFVSTGKP